MTVGSLFTGIGGFDLGFTELPSWGFYDRVDKEFNGDNECRAYIDLRVTKLSVTFDAYILNDRAKVMDKTNKPTLFQARSWVEQRVKEIDGEKE